MNLFSINETEIFSGIDNFIKELDPTNPNSTMGKELQKLDFTSPHTEIGRSVGEFDPANPNSAASRIITEIDPTRNTSLIGKLLTETNIISEDLRSEYGEELRPADLEIFRTITTSIDELFKAIDPTNPKSLVGEGLAVIDPTNPKSLVGEGLAVIDGFLDISKALVKTEIEKIVGEGVTDGLFRIHHHETKFTTLNGKPLNPNEETYFVLHGWESKPENMRIITDALRKNPNANIVPVDWEKDANYLTYFPAALRTKPVAHDVSNYIIENKILPEKVTMIGHSLGAHVAGMASREIYERTGHKVDKVIGLDPAGPGFGLSLILEGLSSPISGSMIGLEGLSKTDASQVVVFHTSEYTLGAYKPIGHLDYFVNSDKLTQPGMGYLDIAGNHSYSIRLVADTLEGKHTKEFPELNTETLAIKEEGIFKKEIK